MFNTQDSLKRRLVYSAQQLKCFEDLNLSEKTNHLANNRSLPLNYDKEENKSFILGYN